MISRSCRLAILSLAFLFSTLVMPNHGRAFAAIPVSDIASQPGILDAAVSPSGRYYAMVLSSESRLLLAIYDAQTNQRVGLAKIGGPLVTGLSWYNDDRVLVRTADTVLAGRATSPFGAFGSSQENLIERCMLSAFSRSGVNMVNASCEASRVLTLAGSEPDTILTVRDVLGDADGPGHIYDGPNPIKNVRDYKGLSGISKLNMQSGSIEVIDSGDPAARAYMADPEGHPRIRLDAAGGKASYLTRAPGAKDWVELTSWPVPDTFYATEPPFEFVGFGDSPNEAVVLSRNTERAVLAVYDLAARATTKTLLSDSRYDVDSAITDRFGRVLGGTIVKRRPEQVFFGPELQRLQRELQSNFASQNVLVRSFSDERKQVIARVEGPSAPGGAFVYIDFARGDGFTIGQRFPKVPQDQISEVKHVSYTSRDGLDLEAYLTLPRGSQGKALAAIVLPHDGPRSRDDGQFDPIVQFLASRGYAVLQTQFRGSRGFGRAFMEKGNGQWGLAMQDDVGDGVRYLISSGVADPKRICIAGLGYGGYAALAGAAFTPELYRCAISVSGPSNLSAVRTVWPQPDSYQYAVRYWRSMLGDAAKNRDSLRAVSPVFFPEKFAAPVLLIHGGWDSVVSETQSRLMAAALKSKNKPHELLMLPPERHNLEFDHTRREAFEKIEAFLLKHNPAN